MSAAPSKRIVANCDREGVWIEDVDAAAENDLNKLVEQFGGAWWVVINPENPLQVATRIWIPGEQPEDESGADVGTVCGSLLLAFDGSATSIARDLYEAAKKATAASTRIEDPFMEGAFIGEPVPVPRKGVRAPMHITVGEAATLSTEELEEIKAAGGAPTGAYVSANATWGPRLAAVLGRTWLPENKRQVDGLNGTTNGGLSLYEMAKKGSVLATSPAPIHAYRRAPALGATQGLRIVVCFDGTCNDETSNTNVLRTFRFARAGNAADGWYQEPIYIRGVGVNNEFDAYTTGYEVPSRMQDAYAMVAALCKDRDLKNVEVFVFGFSRGAYTALLFTEVLRAVGLPPLHASPLAVDWLDLLRRFREQDEPINGFRALEPKFMGLWDTVSQVPDTYMGGWEFHTGVAPSDGKPGISYRPNAAHFYHAIALHEQRAAFDLHPIYTEAHVPQQNLVWFNGTHCDVGGFGHKSRDVEDWGVPAGDVKVQLIPLAWMLHNAEKHGLEFANIPQPAHSYHPDKLEAAIFPLHGQIWNDALNGVLYDSYHAQIAAKTRTPDGKWTKPVLSMVAHSTMSKPIVRGVPANHSIHISVDRRTAPLGFEYGAAPDRSKHPRNADGVCKLVLQAGGVGCSSCTPPPPAGGAAAAAAF